MPGSTTVSLSSDARELSWFDLTQGAAEIRQRPCFDRADFVIRSDGVCRFTPEMARMVGCKSFDIENLRRRPAGIDG
jgi:hypothetical protein